MMLRLLLSGLLVLVVAGCAPTGGILVSNTAEPLGGNLFVETDKDGDQYLVLDGEITADTSYVFQALTESADMASGLVIAQSPGGDLLASHQIGRTIRQKRMNTLVLVSCISACVDVFIAGRNREMTDIAELGLHSATNRDVAYDIDRRYWGELGFGAINERAYSVPNDSLWIISADRALELRLATRVLTPG